MNVMSVPTVATSLPTSAIGVALDRSIGYQESKSRIKGEGERQKDDTHNGSDQARPEELRSLRFELLESYKQQASQEDILFLVLRHAVNEFEARILAQDLLKRFKSIARILVSREDNLINTCNGNEECVALLKSTHLLMKAALLAPGEGGIVFKSPTQLTNYLKISIGHLTNEVYRIIHLNSQYQLIADVLLFEGTINHVNVYPREVIKSVLENDATAVILVHNHPSGELTPSNDDIKITRHLKAALANFNVVLFDHVIVTARRCISMASLGLV